MVDLVFLSFLSLALAAYAFVTQGLVLSDLMLLAILSGVASLFVLFLPRRDGKAFTRPKARDPRDWVVVDGSNVLHWHEGTPKLATLVEVLAERTVPDWHWRGGAEWRNRGRRCPGGCWGRGDQRRAGPRPGDGRTGPDQTGAER